MRFQVGGEEFVLSLARLVNVLIGNDYAELTLRRLDVKEESAWIDSLLDSLESSGALFVRNGKEYSL